jgi:hypothetical protein
MSYRIAGIDVHKKVLAVVVADVEVEGEYQFERRQFGSNPEQLRLLSEWLLEQQVEEAVMESTAQYWRPVWEALERYWQPICQKREGGGSMSGALHLAQALSNRGRRGRKRDFPDAERLVKRLVGQELTLSFVPDAEQRLWRTVMRRKYQAGPAWDFEVTPWPPVDARASLLFVEHHVVDSLALTVFSSLGGDPRLSVGRDHDVRREGGLTTLLGHHFVGAGVDL